MRKVPVFLVLALAAGCLMQRRGVADIKATAEGSPIAGTAVFTTTKTGVAARIAVSGAPRGQHGIHIHEKGDCGDSGKAAGGHFNPAGAKHGFLPRDGSSSAHGGDMGNIDVDAAGYGILQLKLDGLTLDSAAQGIIGRAVILHEKPDDFTQPLGNAGGRIACGIITLKN